MDMGWISKRWNFGELFWAFFLDVLIGSHMFLLLSYGILDVLRVSITTN